MPERPAPRADVRRRPLRAAPKGPEAPGLAARALALRLLGAVLDHGRMIDEAALPAASAPERAEAKGLADLTLRRLGQIDRGLAPFLARPPAGPVRHVLRLMAAELAFAGTAPHAAVDLAVRLARGPARAERLTGLVNAVGRRLVEGGAALFASDAPGRLNMAPWLHVRLAADWGEATADAIAACHLIPAPYDLTLRAPADAEPLAVELGARLLPGGTLRLAERPQLTALPGFRAGAWWAQDAAAALPARLLPAGPGLEVLDLCAAPGGKTMQLAAAGADVTALDLSAKRIERLAENLARTGLAARVVAADAFDWRPPAPVPAILLDAPCSATGTLRRHPDLGHRGAPDLGPLTALQTRLLDRAWDWLAPGGVLVFCTCSLLKAEGEDQAAAFLARHAEARRRPIRRDELPDPAFLTPEGDLRTRPDHWPEVGGLDGFFAFRVEKPQSAPRPSP